MKMISQILFVAIYVTALPFKISNVSAGGDVVVHSKDVLSNVKSGGKIIVDGTLPPSSGRGNNQTGNGNGNTGVGNGVTIPSTVINAKGQNGQDGANGVDGVDGEDGGDVVIGVNSNAGIGDNVVIGNGSNGGVSGNSNQSE
ncbi:hypothetical protein HDV04_001209 [Boothiomyces sp. JEL0838]|nr:hypothetical protein HDV04_001209 [Boothiomyces sp. JEL0838]